MAPPIKVPMPPDMELPSGYTFRWKAVDPTTGAAVTGVTVSATSIYGVQLGGGSGAFKGARLVNPVLLTRQGG